jgi:hypothetical protein
MNSINIGKYIYSKLSDLKANDTQVKVYPLVADNDAKYPFVVYQRNNLYYDTSKDGIYREVAVVQVKIVSDTYNSSTYLANEVRDRLDESEGTFEDYYVVSCHLSGASEMYSSNAFIQTLEFTIEIEDA